MNTSTYLTVFDELGYLEETEQLDEFEEPDEGIRMNLRKRMRCDILRKRSSFTNSAEFEAPESLEHLERLDL